nr:RsmF rRNA methyltransferase first C-terminal domain-containing protein [uncultured Acetatifactor sp.]
MLPRAFLERMQEMLGEEYAAFLESYGREHVQGLRLNPGKIGADGRSAAEMYGIRPDGRSAAEVACSGAAGQCAAEVAGSELAGQCAVEVAGDAAAGQCAAEIAGNGVAGQCAVEVAGDAAAGQCVAESAVNVAAGQCAVEAAGAGAACRDAGFARLSRVPWAEDGYYYEAPDQPGKHPFHEAGVYYIQEPSAMAPVGLMDVRPGERILDLCAAPGGKSVQIAGKLGGSGLLVCNEIHPARAKILSENIERMGIGNACVLNETPERLAEAFPGYFDRVLVDAPCSGEGMFRKSEAAREEWSPENVRLCAERQDGILDCAAGMLRSGGRLVYSTCTFAPEEDEGSVSRFLRRHGEFRILPAEKERLGLEGCDGMPDVLEEALEQRDCHGLAGSPEAVDRGSGLENALRLWPHRIRGEGHFAAVLEKDGAARENYRNTEYNYTTKSITEGMAKGTAKGAGTSLPEEFLRFCAENLRLPESPLSRDPASVLAEAGERAGLSAGGQAPESKTQPPENKAQPPESKTQPPQPGRAAGEKPPTAAKRMAKGKAGAGTRTAVDSGAEEVLPGLGRAAGFTGAVRCMRFGDNLYLVPADMPSFRGLKVLRPGLHLGEVKKNRFEPSHALALALRPACAAHVWNLDSDGPEIAGYLGGQTFPAEGEKGWYLICADGFGTGWGKLAGGIMKNHYPRGLRR